MIDEPAPEETIKFKATEDVIPTEESAEEFIPEREERRANAPEENAEENGGEENGDQTLQRQPAHPRIAKEVSHAQRLHICLTFVGTLLLSLS